MTTETPESIVIGPPTTALSFESKVNPVCILFVFFLTGVFVIAIASFNLDAVITLSETVLVLCACPIAVIKSIASVESIASENVITLPFTVYAELGDCITPLTDTINCSAIKFGCGIVLILSVYDESLVPAIASIL